MCRFSKFAPAKYIPMAETRIDAPFFIKFIENMTIIIYDIIRYSIAEIAHGIYNQGRKGRLCTFVSLPLCPF